MTKYIACLFILAAGWFPALAQLDEGSLQGRVTDQSGAVIAAATVHALNVGTNITIDVTTNESGLFEFPLLAVGKYVLTVEKAGFRRTATEEIDLHAGTKPRLDMVLQLGQVTEAVT